MNLLSLYCRENSSFQHNHFSGGLPWDVVGRKVAKERFLADTYEISKVSVGLPVGLDSDAISMVRLVLGQGRSR